MYKVDEQLLQEVANYLASKPYAEVAQLLQKLGSLEKIEVKEKQNDTNK